jgi:hypothetical protein
MRVIKFLLLILITLVGFSGVADAAPRKVVLIGASVGEAWDLPHAAQRMGRADYVIGYEGLYDFDKTDALNTVLPRKPDAVIIKECAAYFPGNLAGYQRLVKGWVGKCRKAGVMVLLSTSCPVTESGDQLKGIAAYNDWVRAYAAQSGIRVLDLEAALRRGPSDRRMKPEFAQEDGLHLVDRAYRKLDPVLFQTLDKAFSK